MPGVDFLFRRYLAMSPFSEATLEYTGVGRPIFNPNFYMMNYKLDTANDGNPLISIIIPAFNQELYIHKCLQSLCNQTFHNIEIIVIDDASTDNTLQIINTFRSLDSRVNVKALTSHYGTSYARKVGVLAATGKYIMFVDADDTYSLTACEILASEMLTTNYDILQFKTKVINKYNDSTSATKFLKYINNASAKFYNSTEALLKMFIDRTLSINL